MPSASPLSSQAQGLGSPALALLAQKGSRAISDGIGMLAGFGAVTPPPPVASRVDEYGRSPQLMVTPGGGPNETEADRRMREQLAKQAQVLNLKP